MRINYTLIGALALHAPLWAQAGQINPFGCGINPKDSLQATGGEPAIGQMLELSAVDTAGAIPGCGMAQIVLAVSSPLYPCGIILPNMGPGSQPGELLVGLGSSIVARSPLLTGCTQFPWQITIKDSTALVGFTLYSQGLMFDLTVGEMLLTEGLEIKLGVPQSLPNLRPRAVGTDVNVAAPGDIAEVRVVVVNEGFSTSGSTTVDVCDMGGLCGSAALPPMAPGKTLMVKIPIGMSLAETLNNPHFFTASVDPDDRVEESVETDNKLRATKPLMVVQPILVSPKSDYDHDDIITIINGKATSYKHVDYGPDGAQSDFVVKADPEKGGPNPATGLQEVLGAGPPAAPKIAPEVQSANDLLAAGQTIDYVVKYRHSVPMPRLPDLTAAYDRFAPENMVALELRVAMFEGVRLARLDAARDLSAVIEGQYGAVILEHFTLPGSMLVRAKRDLLSFLKGSGDVLHVEQAVEDKSLPPDSVADGRARIDSDPYFNGGATGVTFMGLLDTGIRSTHTLFTGDDHIWFEEDCVNGDANCNDDGSAGYDPDDDSWDHGTSTAAILTGNSDLGNASRGVTSGWLDSWKVYSAAGLSATATLRGFDEAVLWGDKVIVCEIQSSQSETGSIADAADDAYDAGSAVISANGNNGPNDGTANSPGSAHKAIGVGAYDVDSLANQNYVSRGPTSDDRYKPDLQAPTNTDTASTTGTTAINNFGGTSGATPYAAGAASVFADWFGLTSLSDVSSGKIYAGLLVGGTREWDTPYSNEEGVGKFELPLNGLLYYGSRTVSDGENRYVTINVPSSADNVEVAIWWPENPEQTHRDIDVYIQRPDGTTSDSGLSIPSVFERTSVTNAIAGSRNIRIHGFDVPGGQSQVVYYAIHVH